MIVVKFGGTSVENAEAIQRAVHIVRDSRARLPLVVFSACAGATNFLSSSAQLAADGKLNSARGQLKNLFRRHRTIAETLLETRLRATFLRNLHKDIDRLCRTASRLSSTHHLSARAKDSFISRGEFWSSRLLHFSLLKEHVPSRYIDVRRLLVTDSQFGHARPDMLATRKRLKSLVAPSLLKGTVVVTQGFVGRTQHGETTTLGRGGSDYSAALLGAALGVEEVLIWTDVDGVMTADPSIVEHAVTHDSMTYEEATELAHYGAKVVHPRTLLPAASRNIPVRILCSRAPNGKGTVISSRRSENGSTAGCSISAKSGVSVITLSFHDRDPADVLSRWSGLAKKHHVTIESLTLLESRLRSIVSSRVTEAFLDEMEKLGRVLMFSGKALLCVTAASPGSQHESLTTALSCLRDGGIEIQFILSGGSDYSLMLAIEESESRRAMQMLHRHLVEDQAAGLEAA